MVMDGPWRLLYIDATEFPLAADLAERAQNEGLEPIRVEGHDPGNCVVWGGVLRYVPVPGRGGR